MAGKKAAKKAAKKTAKASKAPASGGGAAGGPPAAEPGKEVRGFGTDHLKKNKDVAAGGSSKSTPSTSPLYNALSSSSSESSSLTGYVLKFGHVTDDVLKQAAANRKFNMYADKKGQIKSNGEPLPIIQTAEKKKAAELRNRQILAQQQATLIASGLDGTLAGVQDNMKSFDGFQ